MESFGSLIRSIREKHNWPQRKLAYELDIDIAVLSKINNEDRYPQKRIGDIISIISRLFDISPERLKQIYLSDRIATFLEMEPEFESIQNSSKEKLILL